ncbi:hypothetical protein [Flavobacterium sp.]|uniref:hypothetical protein n=1 Tax=Flavobacterium sp. TaxID=239 RepID=UPI002616F309|nr:hypothetical protein [Flavobacterium sp.]
MVIINSFIKKISKSKSKKEGQNIVNETVIKLNELNKKCHGGLIETEQRENICTIISKMQFQKGYILENEDTTLSLREW